MCRVTMRDADPLDRLAWPVRTPRLVLRRARDHDAERTWRYRRLPAVQEWITAAPRDFEVYAKDFADLGRRDVTVVVEPAGDGGPVIGDLMVRVGDAWAQTEVVDGARAVQAELGWAFDPEHWGKGYATEAVRAMVDCCTDVLGLRRVVAYCFADNTASWRLMERLGMRREGHFRQDSLHRTGRWLDGYTYAMLRNERPAQPTVARAAC